MRSALNFWLLTVCLGFAALGCVRRIKTDPKTLVIGIESEIKNLDFRSTSDANSTHVARLILQGLVEIGPDLLPHPDLALSYTVSQGSFYEFKLPAGLSFHDGKPLTSQDVLYSFKQAAGPGSKMQSSFEDVVAFEAPDATTFRIRLKAPRASFLGADVAAIKVFPAHIGQAPEFGQHPIGSGPYKFVKRENRDLILERFEGYRRFENKHPMPPPFFDRVVVRTIEDPTTRFLSLVGGDIDMLVNALSPRRVVEASQQSMLSVQHAPGNSYQYIGFNFRSPKFQDLRIRKALAMAINRPEIIEHKLKGLASPAASVLSPQNFFFDPNLPQMPYDPVEAKRLLKEAGVQGKLSFELKSSTDRDSLSILQVIQKQWELIGVQVQLRPYEFATFFTDVQKGNFETFSLRWTAVSDPDILFRVFHSKELPPGRNRIAYKNPHVDRLLEQAQREFVPEKRRKLYVEAQEIIANEIPYISLWYPENVVVATTSLRNFVLHPGGGWMSLLDAKKDLE